MQIYCAKHEKRESVNPGTCPDCAGSGIFEYKFIKGARAEIADWDALIARLNAEGMEGWEVCAMNHRNGDLIAKRRKG